MKALYDGMSRAPLRIGLAVIGSFDAVALAWQVHRTAKNDISHPFAPRFLFALHDQPLALALIVSIAIASFVAFARRRHSIIGGALAISALAILSESHAALVGGPARSFYAVGAVTFGWVFGLAYARGVGSGRLGHEVADEERLAEIGAVGVLAATYVGAGASKLFVSGVDWADANHLRAIVVSQHPISDHSLLGHYADAVMNHGTISQAFGLATLFVQLGAFMLLVSPVTRKLWTVGILGFHLNTLFLAHIIYFEAVVLAMLFGLPWPAIVTRLRGRAVLASTRPPLASESPRAARRTFAFALALFAVLAGFGSLPLVRTYTSEHHRSRSPAQPDAVPTFVAPSPGVRALLGGLDLGDELANFRVVSIDGPSKSSPGTITITLRGQDGDATGLVVRVGVRGSTPHRPPRSSDHYDVFYDDSDRGVGAPTAERLDAALDAVLARITATEKTVPMPEGM